MNALTNRAVLVIDDDVTFCSALARAFTRRGYTVYEAHNSETALRIAKEFKPEYAIVDLRIGDESGLQVVEQLKKVIDDIRMVVLTGYASIATAVEAVKLGAVHYLTKPAQPDDILDALVLAVAARFSAGRPKTVPLQRATDQKGRPMQIVYPPGRCI